MYVNTGIHCKMAETEVNIRLHIHYKGKQKYYTDPFLKQQKLKLYLFFFLNKCLKTMGNSILQFTKISSFSFLFLINSQ